MSTSISMVSSKGLVDIDIWYGVSILVCIFRTMAAVLDGI